MQCSSCGHENRDAAKFCEECAEPLKRLCASCGSELRPTAKFCDECGASLAASDKLKAESQTASAALTANTLTANSLSRSPRRRHRLAAVDWLLLGTLLPVCVFGVVMTVIHGVRGDFVVAPFWVSSATGCWPSSAPPTRWR